MLFIVLICVLVALGLCFIPLFQVLGYESAAAMGVVAGVLTAVHTTRLLRTGKIAPLLLAGRRQSPSMDFCRLLGVRLLGLLPPMLVLLCNALVVQNCNIFEGFLFWLVIPTGAVAVGQAVAWGAAAVSVRWALPLALAVMLGEAAVFGWRLAWQPSITGHQWLIGYFSGSIYDEALALPASLLWFRTLNALLVVAVVVLVEIGWRWQNHRRMAGQVWLFAAVMAALLLLQQQRFELGIGVTRQDAVATLGGHHQTEHFDIYYDPSALSADAVVLLAMDHEYNYAQHMDWMGIDVVAWRNGERIRSFVYPSRDVQQRLMGARNTMVARPWTHEMHIRWSGYADNPISHEMAHLFSAAFGRGPLQLPMQGGVFVNIGMLEGFAEAADWPQDELDPHTASAALRALDKAPDLRRLFDPVGFWSQPSRRAYTVMGSFVRYLVDTHGFAPLQQAYGNGDFATAYGRSVNDLITEWESFVDEQPLSEHERELAGYLYRHGSIFERVCARVIGEKIRLAMAAESASNTGRARALWEEIVALEPGSPSHRLALARVLAADGEAAAADAVVQALLQEDQSPAERARALELRGDIAWRDGLRAQAAEAYTEAMQATLPASVQRRLAVKVHGLSRPDDARRWAEVYLLEDNTMANALYAAMQWASVTPDDPVPAYLVGLLLYRMHQHEEAAQWLETAEGLGDQALKEERMLLLARAHQLRGDFQGASLGYTQLQSSQSPRMRVAAEDGLHRVTWQQRHGMLQGGQGP